MSTPKNHNCTWTDAEIAVVALIGMHSIERAARFAGHTVDATRLVWRAGTESRQHFEASPEPDSPHFANCRRIFYELRLRQTEIPYEPASPVEAVVVQA
jgi:hypothetical protein